MSATLKLALIPGDGIGPEVIKEGTRVLEAAARITGLNYQATLLEFGGERYLSRGGDPKAPSIPVITDQEIENLKKYDAIYLGAVGHPDIAPGILEKGLLLKLRFGLDQYINLRPVRLYPGINSPLAHKTPEDIDFLVIRENTEGLYLGAGGVGRAGTPAEISTQEMITTRFGAERCLRWAFEAARRSKKAGKKGELTLVHKTNVLTFCGGTWFRAFEEIGEKDYPDISRNYHHVDACCMYMVSSPESYDVIVVPNMFGDIITDLGAAISGGMGMAASGNINPDPGGVSMFEPVHGSAPDIAGQGKANPMAAILSLAMLLEEMARSRDIPGSQQAADLINQALLKTCPLLRGEGMDRLSHSTSEVGDMVLKQLEDAATS